MLKDELLAYLKEPLNNIEMVGNRYNELFKDYLEQYRLKNFSIQNLEENGL